MPSVRSFLVRGLLAGLLAGLAAFAVAYVVGEPSLSAAVALEEAAAHEHAADEATGTLVPRTLQATLGLATGTVVAGTTLGGLLGVLTALLLGRLGRVGVRATALLLAGAGLVVVQLVPFWAYPPNPPGVGDPSTLGLRTALYFLLLAISVLAAVAALLTGRVLRRRTDGWHAGLAAVGAYLLLVGVALALLPRYDGVPADFPATLLFRFRMAGLLTQMTLWAVLGVALAELLGRLQPRTADRSPVPSLGSGA